MEFAQRIRDDLYALKFNLHDDWYGSMFAVLGKSSVGIIDSGFEETPAELLFPFLERHSRTPEEIDILVNTHRDGDHVLGNQAITTVSSAVVACHPLEADEIEDASVMLENDATIGVGDRTFSVIHVPGHRPGNICLYDPDDQLLISGDAIAGDRKDLIRMGKTPYIASLKKIQALSLRVVVMSHPFSPAGTNMLTGSAIQEMINASIRVAEELEN